MARQPMEHLGMGMVFRTQSSSRVDVSHITIYNPATGVITCTCEGQRSHKHCWHMDEVKQRYGFDDEEEFQVSL